MERHLRNHAYLLLVLLFLILLLTFTLSRPTTAPGEQEKEPVDPIYALAPARPD